MPAALSSLQPLKAACHLHQKFPTSQGQLGSHELPPILPFPDQLVTLTAGSSYVPIIPVGKALLVTTRQMKKSRLRGLITCPRHTAGQRRSQASNRGLSHSWVRIFTRYPLPLTTPEPRLLPGPCPRPYTASTGRKLSTFPCGQRVGNHRVAWRGGREATQKGHSGVPGPGQGAVWGGGSLFNSHTKSLHRGIVSIW